MSAVRLVAKQHERNIVKDVPNAEMDELSEEQRQQEEERLM